MQMLRRPQPTQAAPTVHRTWHQPLLRVPQGQPVPVQVLLAGTMDLEVDVELPVLEEAGLCGETAQRCQGKSREKRWGCPGPRRSVPGRPPRLPRALTTRFQMEPSRLRSSGVRRTYWLVTMVLPWKSHSGIAADPAPVKGQRERGSARGAAGLPSRPARRRAHPDTASSASAPASGARCCRP